ncbi:MAG: hypothetical protein ACE5HW_02545 [Candidatus Methanofastidiosia archaeon]
MKKAFLVALLLLVGGFQTFAKVPLPTIVILSGGSFDSQEIDEVEDICNIIGINLKKLTISELAGGFEGDMLYVPNSSDGEGMLSELKSSGAYSVITSYLDKDNGIMVVGDSKPLADALEEERGLGAIELQGEQRFYGLIYGAPFKNSGRILRVSKGYLTRKGNDRYQTFMNSVYYTAYRVISIHYHDLTTINNDYGIIGVYNRNNHPLEIPLVIVLTEMWTPMSQIKYLDKIEVYTRLETGFLEAGQEAERVHFNPGEYTVEEKQAKDGRVIVAIASYNLAEYLNSDKLDRRRYVVLFDETFVTEEAREEKRISFSKYFPYIVIALLVVGIYAFFKSQRRGAEMSMLEEKIYLYIKEAGGKIDMKTAVKDLKMEEGELKDIIELIRRKGYLE